MATCNYSVSNHAVEQFRARLGTHHWASFDDEMLREKLDQAIFHSALTDGLSITIVSEGRLCTVIDLEPETQIPMVALLTNNEQKAGAGAEFRLVVLTTLTKRMVDAMWSEKRWSRPPEQVAQPLTHGLKLQLPPRPVVEKIMLKPPTTPAQVPVSLPSSAEGPSDWLIYCDDQFIHYWGSAAPIVKMEQLVNAGKQPVLYRQVKTKAKQITVIELDT